VNGGAPIKLGMKRKMFSSVISSPVSSIRGVCPVPFGCELGNGAVLVVPSVLRCDGELTLLLAAIMADVFEWPFVTYALLQCFYRLCCFEDNV